MEIMEIIDMMEETIDKAPVVPLSGKIVVDRTYAGTYLSNVGYSSSAIAAIG